MSIQFAVSSRVALGIWAIAQVFAVPVLTVPVMAQQVPASPPEMAQPTIIARAVYQCDEGKGFSVKFLNNETAQATFGSKVTVLPQTESASGARYSDGSVTLFTKGDKAFVEVGNNTLFRNCVAVGGMIQGLW
jgi:membrane-bound inhibitor of C-type lysozyme